MKVDAQLGHQLENVAMAVGEIEAAGFDGLNSSELNHDPFLPLLLAAEHSERVELATSIAVAFARSPLTLAHLGHDLNAYSQGRMTIGLGSQIKPHITRRFSMPWGAPAAKMRELVLAMRAIWDNWYRGVPLAFEGQHYTHTLMTPAFTPENTEFGAPRVILAAVGPKMTEVAGEVCDGMIVHPFTTLPYLEQVTLPAIEAGLARAGKQRADFELNYGCFVVTGADEAEFVRNKQVVRERIAFYGSTPAYLGVLASIGAEALHEDLNALSKQGRWAQMGELIDDDILKAFAVVGELPDVAGEMLRRYGHCVDRTALTFRVEDPQCLRSVIAALQNG